MKILNKIMCVLMALQLATAPLFAAGEVSTKQVVGNAPLVFDGTNTISGLPIPTTDDEIANKEYVDANTGISFQTITLSDPQTTITNLNGSDRINVFGSEVALAANVSFLAKYKTSTTADFSKGATAVNSESGDHPIVNNSLDFTEGDLTTVDATANYVQYLGDDGSGYASNFRGAAMVLVSFPGVTRDAGSSDTIQHRFYYMVPIDGGSNQGSVVIEYFESGPAGAPTIYRFEAEVRNSSGQLTADLECPNQTIVPGQVYELAIDVRNAAGDYANFYLDGTLCETDSALGALNGPAGMTGRKFRVGHATVTREHNFRIHGVANFDTPENGEGTASYTPVGLPGAGSATQTIATITGTSYEIGERVRLISRDGRIELTDNADPSATPNSLGLNGDWTPSVADEWIEMEWNGVYWIEIGRHTQTHVDATAATIAASFVFPWIYTDTTSNTVEVDLMTCDEDADGKIIRIREVDSTNDTIVDQAGSELLNGLATPYSFDTNSVSGLQLRCKGFGTNIGWWDF